MSETKVKNVRTGAAAASTEARVPAAKLPGNTMEVADERGRSIVVKKLNALDKMRLSRIVGADGSINQAYFGYALLAASVVSIDGDLEPFPKSIQAVEAIVAQLDDDGMAAVGNAVSELNGFTSAAEDMDAAKN